MGQYFCPCCGYATLTEEPPGTYEICAICFWEDDNVQFDDPTYQGGANVVSLQEAQPIFIQFGVSDVRFRDMVRKPEKGEARNPRWELF